MLDSEISESSIYHEAPSDSSDPDSNESSDAGNRCNSDEKEENLEDLTGDSADEALSMEKSRFQTDWTCSHQFGQTKGQQFRAC